MNAKTGQVAIVAFGAAVTGVIIYGMVRRHNAQVILASIDTQLASGSTTGENLNVVDTTTLPSADFPLKKDTAGIQVADIQRAMNKKYGAQLRITGVMDEATLQGLCKWEISWCVFGIGTDSITVDEPLYAKMMAY